MNVAQKYIYYRIVRLPWMTAVQKIAPTIRLDKRKEKKSQAHYNRDLNGIWFNAYEISTESNWMKHISGLTIEIYDTDYNGVVSKWATAKV